MARTHGRIYSRFWADVSGLPGMAQRAYVFLVSQSDMSQAGVLPLRLRRWSQLASDVTPDSLRRDLAVLERASFIVVDDDTEEVLVRTFIRNDQVYRQPNVMLRASEDAKEVGSPRIKAALLAELDRIPLDELSAEVKNGKSPRGVVEGAIADMRKTLSEGIGRGSGNPSTTPPEGFREGSANPLGGVGGGSPEPSTRTRARIHVPQTTNHSSAPTERAATDAPPGTSDAAPQGELIPAAPEQENEGQRVNRLTRIYTDRIKLTNFAAVRGVVLKAVRAERGGSALYSDQQIIDALNQLADENRGVTTETIRIALEGLPPRQQQSRPPGSVTGERAASIQALKRGPSPTTPITRVAVGGTS